MFKEIVQNALKSKNLSVVQFADAIGVSSSAVYAWFSDKNGKNGYKPKADKLMDISKLLDIPLEELIKALEG